ncbi:MAG: protease modulator HflC [Proteobacteria bacterium]|nr:protease modulator HflC [Pseudomonadota bacterium]
MHNRNAVVFFVAVFLLVLINSAFIVDQREQALVLQFGDTKSVVKDSGLHFKIPFVQNVVKFDMRVLDHNASANEIIAADQKRLIVDAFVKYRIVDPLKFYQTVRRETIAEQRLDTFLDSSLREVLGSYPLSALLTGQRSEVMKKIAQAVGVKARGLGMEVVDVRIMRADLPQTNSEAIFKRMQTEREREAKEFRAKGAEDAQGIRSRADKERTIILAEAQKKAQILRGEGDAQAAQLFSSAFNRDPEFYSFYRTMQAYRASINKDDTSVVLSPDSEFMKYFDKGAR